MKIKEKKLFNSRPLFYGFLALLLAMSTTKYLFDVNIKYIVFDVLILTCVLAYSIWAKRFVFLLVVLAAFTFGMRWFFLGVYQYSGNVYTESCLVQARVTDDFAVSKYKNNANIVLKDVYINDKKEKNIYLNLNLEKNSTLQAGDNIIFSAEVNTINMFELGNFQTSYYRKKVSYKVALDESEIMVFDNHLKFDEKIRLKVKTACYQNMGEENGAVAYAVLVGDKSEIDADIKTAYNKSGILHLLTVSGLHISFLIVLLGVVLKHCHIKGLPNFIICAVFLFFYTYICGFSPSVLRAGIMGLVLLTTQICGKCYDRLNSLGLAGILILLIFPYSALDIGFLMSFFSVLGIFVVSPSLTNLLKKFMPMKIAQAMSISISATIGILPFIAKIYGVLNFLSFLVNLIVVPFFGVLYPVLFVGTIFTILMPFCGFILKMCSFGFNFIATIADFFSKTTLAISLKPFNIFLVALLFLSLFLTSKFFMAPINSKSTTLSCVWTLTAIVGIFSFIPSSPKPVVVSTYNYSKNTILLTNSAKESIIVDCDYYNFTENLKRATNVSDISTLLLLNKASVDLQTVRSLGISIVGRADSGQGFEEETFCEYDQTYYINGFWFNYLTVDGKLVGLEIEFDDTKVFILKNKKLSEAVLTKLSTNSYDFVMLGKRTSYASYFSSSKNVLGYSGDKDVDVNYIQDGNIAFDIVGGNYKRRCLD